MPPGMAGSEAPAAADTMDVETAELDDDLPTQMAEAAAAPAEDGETAAEERKGETQTQVGRFGTGICQGRELGKR